MAPDPHDESDLDVVLEVLAMDGDEASTAAMCPTSRPRESLQLTEEVFSFRDAGEICAELQAERTWLLNLDGTPQEQCKEKVYTNFIPFICHLHL